MTIADSPIKTATALPRVRRRAIADLLAPLDQIAAHSPNLVANHEAKFDADGETYELPRYLFVGPKGGDTPIRVGIFAGIHGDEPEGTHALVQFIKLLEAKPELAAGYYLSLYPVCNPTGFEDGTRFSRGGKDLNREFWKNSAEAEVRLLQAELVSRSFGPGHHLAAHRRHEQRLLRLRPRRDADKKFDRTRLAGCGKIASARRASGH
jgi:hypothetical protein